MAFLKESIREIMTQLNGQNIICIATSDWDYPYGSRQQIMKRLSKHNRILFVESQISILHGIKYLSLFLKKLRNSFRGVWILREINENLCVFSPPPIFFPFDNYSIFINIINQRILLFLLKGALKRINLKPSIFWIFHPRHNKLIGVLSERISIYHCIDEYSAEKNSETRRRVLAKLEEETLKKVDIVFACSENIYKAKNNLHGNTYLLRPGIDMEGFKKALKGNRVHSDIEKIKSPKIGFAGTVNRRLDINLIHEIALQRPEWSFVLIGINQLNCKANRLLKKLNNIHLLGFKSLVELPCYLMAMDICIIPYIINEFTKAIFPLKLFEYLAVGKPIISTPLPDLEFFSNVVTIGKNSSEFIICIEELLASENNKYADRLNIAESNTWEIRVKEASHIICKVMNNQRNAKEEA